MSLPSYPTYKSSGVEWLGEIPTHWDTVRLKQLVQPDRPITYGIVQAGPNQVEGVPYIRPTDMTDEAGIRAMDELLRTTPEIAATYARSAVSTGDIVCSIGPSFGKVMVVPPELEGANLTQGTARIATGKDYCPRFVYWVLRSTPSKHQWEVGVGGATFRALNLEPLSETVLAAPKEHEQKDIADFLDCETSKIDALIAEQKALLELLSERRSALIAAAVTGKIDVRGAVLKRTPV